MGYEDRFPANLIPTTPFVGLFGNHHNNWRAYVTAILTELGIETDSIYDSTDKGWVVVDDHNGDELQEWIDELVARQHRAMRAANCLVFALDSRTRKWPTKYTKQTVLNPPEGDLYRTLYAARCELGWLAGVGKPTFAWVSGELSGRNYLQAVIGLYDNLRVFPTLEEAAFAAAARLHQLHEES